MQISVALFAGLRSIYIWKEHCPLFAWPLLRSRDGGPRWLIAPSCFCKVILAWWYVYVSDLFLSCSSRYSCTALIFFFLLMRRFRRCFHFYVATHSCVALIRALHPFMRCLPSCAAFIHVLHSVPLPMQVSDLLASLLHYGHIASRLGDTNR